MIWKWKHLRGRLFFTTFWQTSCLSFSSANWTKQWKIWQLFPHDPKQRKKLFQAAADAAAAPPPAPSQPVDSDAVFSKLEAMGFQVGLRLAERLTKDHPRFKDELDTMKFICTDLWKYVYEKQIDTLRTNNQGTYVLTDNLFKTIDLLWSGRNRPVLPD